MASIAFRTTPGKAGSTSVWFHGGLTDIINVHKGETHDIPNTMGRVTFANVTQLTAIEIAGGKLPEVIGTVTLVVESDLSPNKAVDKMLTDAAAEAKPIIAKVTEAVTVVDVLFDPDELAERMSGMVTELEAALRPSFGQILSLFLGSAGDPDDPIGYKLNVFVAVDDGLASLVYDQLGKAIPAEVGVAGGLRPRSYTQQFAGRGAVYEVSFEVEK